MIEYFDERCSECIKDSNGNPDIEENYRYLKCMQAYYTTLNNFKDVRLSEIYYGLGIPFPDDYLIDYKFKKNEEVFEVKYDEKLVGKIRIDFNVPDQWKIRSTEDTVEYTFVFHKEEL